MPVTRLLAGVRAFPAARGFLRRRFERRFRTPAGAGALCGVYESFAEAAAAAGAAAAAAGAPAAVGYDRPAAAELYADRHDEVFPKDYPALFWLARALAGGAGHVFDLGGHVGVAHYAFGRYLDAPPARRWTVCDVPAVAAAGAELARRRGAEALAFTTEPEAADGADVLLAAGSLQYIERPLGALLAALAAPPRHVVVNQTPTHPAREFYTVQHVGVAYCPYRVAREGALPEALAALGYRLADRWADPTRDTGVPYRPETAPIRYTGYYLRRD